MAEGNDRYQRHCKWAAENCDAEALALHHKVWDPTPWVLDVRLPESNTSEWFELLDWCVDNLGRESWPIHGRPGSWYRSGVTIHGHTDMGFATEEMMRHFMERFPDRIWPLSPSQ